MEGPPLGPGGEDITWPDQVAPRGRKASSTRKIKPQTSNLLVVTTGEDRKRVLGIPLTHLYMAAPVPRPPLPAPAALDGVHTFLRTQEVTAVTGVHLVLLPRHHLTTPGGPGP